MCFIFSYESALLKIEYTRYMSIPGFIICLYNTCVSRMYDKQGKYSWHASQSKVQINTKGNIQVYFRIASCKFYSSLCLNNQGVAEYFKSILILTNKRI